MFVYGRNAVHEAIRGPRTVSRVWATQNAAREPWLGQSAVRVTIEPADEIARRSGSDGHQGICAEVSEYEYVHADSLLDREQALIVALDQVQDPQNLGA